MCEGILLCLPVLRALHAWVHMCLAYPFNPFGKGIEYRLIYLGNTRAHVFKAQWRHWTEGSSPCTPGTHKSSPWIRGECLQTVWTSLWSVLITLGWNTDTYVHMLPAHKHQSHFTTDLMMMSLEVWEMFMLTAGPNVDNKDVRQDLSWNKSS